MLRSIIHRIFAAVRESDNAIKQVWGGGYRSQPGYREALIDVAVCVNAAHSAFDLRHEVERAGKTDIKVLYGVFSLQNNQISMPVDPWAAVAEENVNLAHAPVSSKDFNSLALRMAEKMKASSGPAQKPALAEKRRESHDHIGMEMPYRPL
jgi:carbonic anhydrase